jgi:hypothetical protein
MTVSISVIPAKAGTQTGRSTQRDIRVRYALGLGPRLRGDDSIGRLWGPVCR